MQYKKNQMSVGLMIQRCHRWRQKRKQYLDAARQTPDEIERERLLQQAEHYGRIVNDVRWQDAKLQELMTAYQQKVLTANQEAEDGLVTFLRAQERTKMLEESVQAAQSAVEIVVAQLQGGKVDFNRYATIEQNLVTQQDTLAQARGQIADGLISVYRALGGGWQIRPEDK